ncbi:uncharacterized protein LOC114537762 [Dendronephthya gigantea]|uniref:uncharacterized protein LOC114537762 n=1 Tax=Dendronephthya gigantea TaxID=151771 RepID=UPI00106B0FA4|nr:uncharacterized protein LOC114537762 [Dendronephthya gigantea]
MIPLKYFAFARVLFACIFTEQVLSKESKWKKTGKFHALSSKIDFDHDYKSLGCWKAEANVKYFEDLEGLHDELDGLYWQRLNTIKKCAAVTKNKGFKIFALINRGECFASKHKDHVYRRFGRSSKCSNGEGGVGAMNVYKLTGESFSDSEDFEDDIILTKAQKALIDNPDGPLYHDGVDLETSAAMVLWPENTVPYYVPPELAKTKVAQRFLAGIKQWQQMTCVKFVPRGNHRDWVQIFRERNPLSRRCASAIGRIGRYQPIRVGDLCPAGSLIHEWGHALGLWHEQSREDRDGFVKVNWDNILPGKKDQFKKYRHFSANTLSIKYDYMSIMHYGKDYFAKLTEDQMGYLTTLEALNDKYRDKIGQRKHVTSADAAKVNVLYGCADFPYMWRSKDWSECSSDCGSGTKHRELFCAKSDLVKVQPKYCSKSTKPLKKLACYGRKCSTCPSGWFKLGKACYKAHNKLVSWFEARKTCLQKGSDLLTLKTKPEEASIRSYLKSKNIHLVYYWLGAYYHAADGDFYWVDDSRMKYNDWKTGEPRWNVNCALMIHREQWGTDVCTVGRRFICKKEIV